MNRLVALHGKPGTGDDWQSMFQALALYDAWQTVAPTRPARGAPLDTLIGDLDRTLPDGNPGKTVVMAYSWGCYLALQHLFRGKNRPDALVLVNPYLVAESSISPVVNLLVSIPGLGGWLVGRSVEKRAADYLASSFAPDPVGERSEHLDRLNNPELWLGAVQATNLHNAHPLPAIEALPVPVLALVGAEDTVAAWSTHGAALPDGPNLRVETVPAAGHALAWLHHEHTVPLVRSFLSETFA